MSAARDKSELNPGQRAALAEEQAAQRRKERRLLAGIVVGVLVLLVGAGTGFQAWRANRAPRVEAVAPGQASTPTTVTAGQPISFGAADAPVRIDLYEDFHCPHCADFEEAFGQTLTDAQSAGRVTLRIFPMAFIDAGSLSAANAFGCAAEAGFGEVYYKALFANHTLDWSDSQLLALAAQVDGSVPDSFSGCVTQRGHEDWVSSINDAASAAGVTGTPTMFLDGDQVDLTTMTPEGLTTKIAEAAKQ